MFVSEVCAEIREAYALLEEMCSSCSSGRVSTEELKEIIAVGQVGSVVSDRIVAAYSASGDWINDGYLSAKTAVVHETGLSLRSVDSALSKGDLLNDFPAIMEGVKSGLMTTDHVACLVPIAGKKYREHFEVDVDMLVKTAQNLSVKEFSYVVRYWKGRVDDIIDEPTDEYKAFQKRELYLHETIDGSWFLQAWLDPVTGKRAYKAFEDVREKHWRDMSPEKRLECTPAQQRVDAFGSILQGYLSCNVPAVIPVENIGADVPSDAEVRAAEYRFTSNPALTADIVIDINDLDPRYSTHAFLSKCLDAAGQGKSPLISTHSRKHLEQILCDTILQLPIKNTDGTYDLGRKVRTAPAGMKKQLMLSSRTCSIAGCTMPAHWCEAHHIEHWAHGGPTNLDNLALLCSRHHTMIHNDKTFAEKTIPLLNHHPQHDHPPPIADTG
ncbi:MAG TPA: HNH endonuclease [Acidimicrobiia bacterium]|nr:HNH endonuclease [Acidimicrobiia bacterium]